MVRLDLFLLELKVEGFPRTDADSKKSYCKGKVIKWNVELAGITLDMLLSNLANEVNWGDNKAVSLWFFDLRLGEDVRLVNEIQMIDLFEMYRTQMHCQIVVGVVDKDLQLLHEWDELEPICMVPPDSPVPHVNKPSEAAGQTSSKPCEPQAPKAKKCAQSNSKAGGEANAEAEASKPDMFDNEEEYVGVNDESIYMSIPESQPPDDRDLPAQEDAAHTGYDSDPEMPAKGTKHPEAEVNDVDPKVYNVVNDPLNPKIEEGALFSDIITFRKAVRHYAICRGFVFAGLKSDKTRFIAKCAHKGCPWRIHASRIHDQRTIQVRVLLMLSFFPLFVNVVIIHCDT